MWDELSAAAMIDPSIVTGQKELYVDIDVDHGPSYGETLFWDPGTELPPYERKATVQFDVDTTKLYDLYIKLMTQPRADKRASDIHLTEQTMMDSKPPFRVTRRQFVTTSAAALWPRGSLVAGFALCRPAPAQNRGRRARTRRRPLPRDHRHRPRRGRRAGLLLAMRSPELKIEGITPVAGNVPLELTLPNALRMVEIAGRTDIPVAAGAKAPLLRRLVTAAYAHGENGLGGAVFPEPKTKPDRRARR